MYCGGSWGTVCDDEWGFEDAHVICQMLGYGSASIADTKKFGAGDGDINLDEVRCTGTEETIFDCNFKGCKRHNCQHHEDVGIVCKGK